MTALPNAWSHVHYCDGTIKVWRELLERHLADAEACGDDSLRTMYLGWLGDARCFHGDFDGSLASLDRVVAVGGAARARIELGYVTDWRAHTLLELGRVADGTACARSLDLSEAECRIATYAFAKCQAALGFALALTGEHAAALDLSRRLIGFGQAGGNCRAEAFGHIVQSIVWSYLLDFENAQAEAEAGVRAARDDVFFLGQSARPGDRPARGDAIRTYSREACDVWIPYFNRHENRWFAPLMRALQCSARIALGDMSEGLRGLLATVDEVGSRELGGLATTTCNVCLVSTWVAVARRDVRLPLGALLADPWFTFTQAPWAARRAANLIARLRARYAAADLHGPVNLLDFAAARLQVHRGDPAGARECLGRIESRRAKAGLTDRPSVLRDLAEQIERRGRRG